MQCPKCGPLNITPMYFCSQTCFKGSWKHHIEYHKYAVRDRDYTPPPFTYAGDLRPHFVTPMRDVGSVARTEYYLTGIPETEMKAKKQRTIHICTPEEVDGIREACRIGREVLDIAASMVRPGVTTEEIDYVVHQEMLKRDAYPSPLNYHYFPKSCCTSVNEIICHGIPDMRPLEEGDIVNLDITAYYKGYHGDLNETYSVGTVDKQSKKLMKVTYDALQKAIEHVKPGTMVRDFGDIIGKFVRKEGFSVVRAYCGHGIGDLFHSAPSIPHYPKNKGVGVLKPGMVFTIEPMINAGKWEDITWPDDWTSSTKDGSRSAQFEHTMVVTETGVEVLTARTPKSVPFYWETKPKIYKGYTGGAVF